MAFTIDVDEGKWSKEVLETLLIDRTTDSNIVWGTYDYEFLGSAYHSHYPILYELITGANSNLIQPRVMKTRESKGNRTKERAEVFTPSWVCNIQNNMVDSIWFDRVDVFNVEKEQSWETTSGKIVFFGNKTWTGYVDENRLEITCGEAPYLVSRYDAVSGVSINVSDRIGLLDRKMRVVKENASDEKEWLKWAERAFQSVYGYEFQGDSLLIARENLLASYCDYMLDAIDREPTEKELLNIAEIISWNLWQMDGLTFTIPYQEPVESNQQLTLLDYLDVEKKVLCIIKDWRANEIVVFRDLLKRGDC